MDTTRKHIGARIRAVRERLKLNQKEFSKLVGVSNTAVSSYENGDTYPSLPALIQIAGHGGVSFDWLISGMEIREVEQRQEESRLLLAYRQLPREDQVLVLKIAEYISVATRGAR